MPYGGPSLNETFCRALLRARLTEEDIAARLGVDPKTVRRWIEGRALPYRRHRWALATMLDTAETDLWPELRSAQPRPAEVVAVYPHLGTVPRDVWLRLFGSAKRNISLLDHLESPLARDGRIIAVLAERARAGATIRICLADPQLGGSRAAGGAVHRRQMPTVRKSGTRRYATAVRQRSGCIRVCCTASSTAPMTRSLSPSVSTVSRSRWPCGASPAGRGRRHVRRLRR